MQAGITAATGFLVAVLWFDLMFDVQAWRYRRSARLPDDNLASISSYYRRVTIEASPMGRLVGVVMVVLLALLVAQRVDGAAPVWVSVVSLTAAGAAIGLALGRVVPTRGGWATPRAVRRQPLRWRSRSCGTTSCSSS